MIKHLAFVHYVAVFGLFIPSVLLLTIWRHEVALWVLPVAGMIMMALWGVIVLADTALLERGKEMDRRVAWIACFLFLGALVVYGLNNPNLPVDPNPQF